jgi:two-component system, OmpR family, alkaline phosphatase synthesis response regulator PhoP
MNVLIAEDDPHILDGLVQILTDDGYASTGVSNGKEALRSYKESRPDFIILDIMMPEINGYDVCREIRRDDSTTPILFLSAKSEEIDKVIGLELGADDFVSKPFGTRELMARVRAISRRVLAESYKESTADGAFSMNNLTIVPNELRAYRDNSSIDLNPRDIEILTLLFQRKGKVVSRTELFDKVWGTTFYGTTRAMDQHISQLRKKIEVDSKNPGIIKTVHGTGYRFEV